MGKQPRAWIVDFDGEAVIDFEEVKSRGERRAVFNVVQKLKDLGSDLPSPHMKSLKGRRIYLSCGRSKGPVRLGRFYARLGSRFVILAVAAKKKDFGRAVAAASDRLSATVDR